jgi:predicted phosphodiesterase
MDVNIERIQCNYHRYVFNQKQNNADFKFMFSSDWHFDNPKCNRDLLFKHLDYCLKNKIYIIVNGDLLCLMQGKYDPRRNKSAVRPEHNGDMYLDLVINSTAEKLKKYAHLILQINSGNHETSVSQRTETNVLERLINEINRIANTNIQLGEYMGYIGLLFSKNNGNNKKLIIAYDHGHWGGVVTKGALSVTRHASMFPQADVVISGHTHDGWIMNHPRYVMNSDKKKVSIENQWHVKTGTYKEEFEKGKGWAVEKIGMPKYLGSCFMDVKYHRENDLEYTFSLTY